MSICKIERPRRHLINQMVESLICDDVWSIVLDYGFEDNHRYVSKLFLEYSLERYTRGIQCPNDPYIHRLLLKRKTKQEVFYIIDNVNSVAAEYYAAVSMYPTEFRFTCGKSREVTIKAICFAYRGGLSLESFIELLIDNPYKYTTIPIIDIITGIGPETMIKIIEERIHRRVHCLMLSTAYAFGAERMTVATNNDMLYVGWFSYDPYSFKNNEDVINKIKNIIDNISCQISNKFILDESSFMNFMISKFGHQWAISMTKKVKLEQVGLSILLNSIPDELLLNDDIKDLALQLGDHSILDKIIHRMVEEKAIDEDFLIKSHRYYTIMAYDRLASKKVYTHIFNASTEVLCGSIKFMDCTDNDFYSYEVILRKILMYDIDINVQTSVTGGHDDYIMVSEVRKRLIHDIYITNYYPKIVNKTILIVVAEMTTDINVIKRLYFHALVTYNTSGAYWLAKLCISKCNSLKAIENQAMMIACIDEKRIKDLKHFIESIKR